MVLPAVNPLDSLIKLAKSRGDALVKLLGDGTQQPAMWRCPAHVHVDELTLERVIKAGRLWGNCEALRQQASPT